MKIFKKIPRNRIRRAALAMTGVLALMAGAVAAKAETLVIGSLGKDAKTELKEHEGLAKYLQHHLSASGVDKVEVRVVYTAAQMAEALRTGAVHLYFDSPLVAAKVGLKSGAVPFLRRWKKGVAEYWSEILVRSEVDVRSLDDLRGRVIAFEDPDSTSGHLLPRAMLLDRGLEVETIKQPADPFNAGKVGAVFTNDDKSSILQLLSGRVAAIGTDSEYAKIIAAQRPGAARSIARSIAVPRHVAMRAAAVPEARGRRIAEILVGMHESEEGRRVLASFGKTDRFDTFPQGYEATFEPIHAQLRLLEADPALETQ